jgi:diadenosine tetraphosphate (Ap4A) HIT family hydrolase
MKYKEFLKNLKKCPFCNLEKSWIIKENKHAILTLSRIPDKKDHLLIIPKKHVLKLNELNFFEKRAINKLINYTYKKLGNKYSGLTILYREGEIKLVGKSTEHLHIHFVPNGLYASEINRQEAEVYPREKMQEEINKMKKIFK